MFKISLKITCKLAIKIETVSCPCNTCFWILIRCIAGGKKYVTRLRLVTYFLPPALERIKNTYCMGKRPFLYLYYSISSCERKIIRTRCEWPKLFQTYHLLIELASIIQNQLPGYHLSVDWFMHSEVQIASVVILGCVSWTIRNDYGGFDDRSSTATTVHDCRTQCSNNVECTAIDWVAALSTGSQCWLVGPWTTSSGYRAGIQRHTISRTFNGRGCTFAIIEHCIIFPLLCRYPWMVIWKWEIGALFSVEKVIILSSISPKCRLLQ